MGSGKVTRGRWIAAAAGTLLAASAIIVSATSTEQIYEYNVVEELRVSLKHHLEELAHESHHPQPQFGIHFTLDPFTSTSSPTSYPTVSSPSSSSPSPTSSVKAKSSVSDGSITGSGRSMLKYVHEGDMLTLKLKLRNISLHGVRTLVVKRVGLTTPSGIDYDELALYAMRLGHNSPPDYEETDEEMDLEITEDDHFAVEDNPMGVDTDQDYDERTSFLLAYGDMDDKFPKNYDYYGGYDYYYGDYPAATSTDSDETLRLEGFVEVNLAPVRAEAVYTVRGNAGGYLAFTERGDLELRTPSLTLTSYFNLTFPEVQPTNPWRNAKRKSGRGSVLVQGLRTEVDMAGCVLQLTPRQRPPEWVHVQLQNKLQELADEVEQGRGPVPRLVLGWSRLLKRLIKVAINEKKNKNKMEKKRKAWAEKARKREERRRQKEERRQWRKRSKAKIRKLARKAKGRRKGGEGRRKKDKGQDGAGARRPEEVMRQGGERRQTEEVWTQGWRKGLPEKMRALMKEQ
ncbi:uncharacterized protein LOC143022398 [Oratosquilla oratoria]|uniref:uncharacterized protein LOC143022398 n=1 Tax=Oratosquilla oratoria TaxID=337810 RepID=UPI003F77420A